MKRVCYTALLFGAAVWAAAETEGTTHLRLTVGKSHVLETAAGVERVAVASGDIVEAVAVSQREVVLNAKSPGETSVIIWPRNGGRRISYDVTVEASPERLEALRRRLRAEVAGSVTVEAEEKSVILRGAVPTMADAERAVALASTLGKPVSLLKVAVPATEPQVLLKVRFADVDRSASTELGANLISTGAANTPGLISTQQFSPPQPKLVDNKSAVFTISDALNVFLFRPDLNLAATIRALQAKHLVEILAEPNVLAAAGQEASFLAGGEFPYPVVQSGTAGLNTVTILFREFGVRIKFTPTFTPRGTIRLRVAPEVSALDYANGLVYQGFNIPGLSVRRVQTEVELQDQQSFAIAGLLDNRLTETMNKVPGLGNIPLFGKLFQSRSTNRNKSELLVMVTPELVNPIPAGAKQPAIEMPKEFMKEGAKHGAGRQSAGGDHAARAIACSSASVPGGYEAGENRGGDGGGKTPDGFGRGEEWQVSGASAERIPVTLAISGEALRGLVLEALQPLPVQIAGDNCPTSDKAELLAAIARQRPAILLLGLPGLPYDVGELLASVGALEAAPRVIAVNDGADPQIILSAMRAGAGEFTYPPFEDLAGMLDRSAAEWQRRQRNSRGAGSTIGFVSAKGGCGATTIACHAGAFLQSCGGKDVLLADFDLSAGMACMLMQANPRYTLSDALNNLDRMDATLWKALAAKAPSGVDLIPPPQPPADLTGAFRKLSQLLRFWRLHYDVTIADLGSGISNVLVEVADAIDSLVIVATNEVPALRQAKQMVETLLRKKMGYKTVRLVVNRLPRRTEIQLPELERIIGYPVFSALPNDYKALIEAYSDGRLLDADSPLGSQIAELAGKLAGVPVLEAKKKNRRFALFG